MGNGGSKNASYPEVTVADGNKLTFGGVSALCFPPLVIPEPSRDASRHEESLSSRPPVSLLFFAFQSSIVSPLSFYLPAYNLIHLPPCSCFLLSRSHSLFLTFPAPNRDVFLHSLSQGGWTYVDVRTAEEFKAGHPSGAVNIPMHVVDAAGEKQPNPHFKATLQNTFTDKNHQLVVGCRSGARSGKTCELLLGLGYKNVKNLEGGFMAWEEARLPTHKL